MDFVTAAFPDKSLYEILGVSRDASTAVLKKAYYKMAILYHPDKSPDDPTATSRFQALSLAHAVLSEPERRAEYDATGEFDDGSGGGGGGAASFATWSSYWRAQFPAFDESDIDAFAAKYKGSAEESADVLAAYATCEGDMDEILDCVPCADSAASGAGSDVDRFVSILHAAFADGLAEPLDAFTSVYGTRAKGGSRGAAAKAAAARAGKARAEAAEAEEYLETLRREHVKKHGGAAAAAGGRGAGAAAGGGGGGAPTLAEMMRKRGEERAAAGNDFLTSLEQKYGGGGGAGGALLTDKPTAKRSKRK